MSWEHNPGSPGARDAGCLCPVLDNAHGKFPPFPPGTAWGGKDGGWYIRPDCPIHGGNDDDG